MHLDGPQVPMALACGHSICGDCQDVVAQAHADLRSPVGRNACTHFSFEGAHCCDLGWVGRR